MVRRALVWVVVLATSASAQAEERLQGAWTVDTEAMLEVLRERAEGMEVPFDAVDTRQRLEDMRIDLEVGEDGITVTQTFQGRVLEEESGSWTLRRTDPSTWTLTVTPDGGEPVNEWLIWFPDEDHLVMALEGQEIHMHRVVEEEVTAAVEAESRRAHHVVVRLRPGQDLKQELLRVVEARGLSAVAVVTCVGSLTEAALRFADAEEYTTLAGPLEIVSLVGTLGPDGAHVHLSVADGAGRVIGGHLGSGSRVYTTAELVLVSLDDVTFRRDVDPETTYRELTVEPR